MLFILSSVIPSCEVMFYSFNFQPECCLNYSILIPFLSCSDRSGSRIYLFLELFILFIFAVHLFYPSALDIFIFSHAFLLYLILFLFHLVPKISGRDLLLVEESCNAPNPMRQVSSSYSSLLPCQLLVCCILPCHHLHFICMFFKTCIRSGPPGSLRCLF